MGKPVFKFNSASELRKHLRSRLNLIKPIKRTSKKPKIDQNWLKERYLSYPGEKTTGGYDSRYHDRSEKYLHGEKDFYRRRENGRFGSHCSFDGMDDESFS